MLRFLQLSKNFVNKTEFIFFQNGGIGNHSNLVPASFGQIYDASHLFLVYILRAVPTIVIAHTFCASRDIRVFLSVMLSNTVIFLCG